ncbi:MAG: hypothetical protein ACFFDF_01615 [Candidatus Odinarchaeota archaeon]
MGCTRGTFGWPVQPATLNSTSVWRSKEERKAQAWSVRVSKVYFERFEVRVVNGVCSTPEF